ncbi:mannosyltransferase [Martiniozyma asiatica (nom. inval.)]|nr:mannosyltransferase [Martiniozyma asiatica]
MAYLVTTWAISIFLLVFQIPWELIGTLHSINDHFQVTQSIISRRFNESDFLLQRSKLKPQSNSYISPLFPKYIEPVKIENKHAIDTEIDYSKFEMSTHVPIVHLKEDLHPTNNPHWKLQNATILVLCRNWELEEILGSMRSLEDRFNKDYHYPWTFLNDEPFTVEFIQWTSMMASGSVSYELIPSEDWDTPDHIDEEKYDQCVQEFIQKEIIYGHSKSYRNMCHFNSGYFFRQELTNRYDYYMRVEPGVEYFCDFQMDPFRLMKERQKKYGFIVGLHEYPETIPTLWDNVKAFFDENPNYLHPNSAIDFLIKNEQIGFNPEYITDGIEYNMCHFWSNFEIGDLNFFRSKEYIEYFEYLSNKGGFHYERWGDAPVHSIAAAMLLDKDEVHHFEDIGYYHVPFYTFPSATTMKLGKKCVVEKRGKSFAEKAGEHTIEDLNISASGCLSRWWKYGSGKRFLREYWHSEDFF